MKNPNGFLNPMAKQGTISPIEKIRHSLAHVLAMAVLEKFPQAKLGIGPTVENGFYYDFKLPKPLSPSDLPALEAAMKKLIASGLEFSGRRLDPSEAKKLFKSQPFKLELIKELAKEKKQLTIYAACPATKTKNQKLKTKNCFTDLCRGGHVKHTKKINPESFRLVKIAAAYWKGDEKNPQLTRIYGAAFATAQELADHLRLQEEIQKRDHRLLGEKLDLFSQHDIAPGAIFWHPKGMTLWRELERFMRSRLDRSGYGEVSTPVMVKKEVFETSGHWDYFRENMFIVPVDKETYVLKPMNCPESTYIYGAQVRSYRDLPLRFSEITDRLHRNELTGVLGGLFRVRQMSQDDAHIYCRPDQIESEIGKLIALIKEVYNVFHLPLLFKFATRPAKAMGSPKLWKTAEAALEAVLKKSGTPYETKLKDGAFYGPKIDIHCRDALKREWQVATIQLDFQMPARFKLSYIDAQGKKQTPVMIHRAVLGTFERFIAILIEHYAGAFPFWLAPVQIAILPISDKVKNYCLELQRMLHKQHIRLTIDERNESIGRKIREAEMQKIPCLLVVGEREAKTKTVSIRERGKGDRGAMALAKFLDMVTKLSIPA